MARIRTIKPEFWTSEQVAECSPTARLLFIGLWNFCDDNGIHPSSPKRIKMEIFPADDFTVGDIQKMVSELTVNGLLDYYEVENIGYLRVTGWSHQKIDKPSYKFPLPEFDDHSTNAPGTFDDRSPPEGKGMESKGKEERALPPPVADAPEEGRSLEEEKSDQGEEPKPPKPVKYPPGFERFWQVYPKTNGSKKAAFDRWKRDRLEGISETIVPCVSAYLAHRQSLVDAQQFAPEHPFAERWLKERRWEAFATEHAIGPPGHLLIEQDDFLRSCLQTVRDGGSISGPALAHVTAKLGEDWRRYV